MRQVWAYGKCGNRCSTSRLWVKTVVGVLVANGDLLDLEKIQAGKSKKLASFKHPRQLVLLMLYQKYHGKKFRKNFLRLKEYKQTV